MLQGGDGLDLALEALDADPLRELGRQNLYHHLPLEPRLLGHEDARHPAAAEFAFESVGAGERRLELVAELLSHAGWTRGGTSRANSTENERVTPLEFAPMIGWPLMLFPWWVDRHRRPV
jgi:hypothetical protein